MAEKNYNDCMKDLKDAQQTDFDNREAVREADLFINKRDNFSIGMPDQEFYSTATSIPPGPDNPDPYFFHIRTLLSPYFE